MPVCFLDSSALVKCYVAETGSVWTRSILDDENNIVYVASLSRVETISALTRRFRRSDISQIQPVVCVPRLPRNKKVNTSPARNPPMCAM
jgi:predicted nucleic acid-binding protein